MKSFDFDLRLGEFELLGKRAQVIAHAEIACKTYEQDGVTLHTEPKLRSLTSVSFLDVDSCIPECCFLDCEFINEAVIKLAKDYIKNNEAFKKEFDDLVELSLESRYED